MHHCRYDEQDILARKREPVLRAQLMSRFAPTLLLFALACILAHGVVVAAETAPLEVKSLEEPVPLVGVWQAVRASDEDSEPADDDPRWTDVSASDVLGASGSVDFAGVTWLRTTIDLPSNVRQMEVGLRIGSVAYGGVTARFNGHLIGVVGPTAAGQEHVLVRPITFDVPADVIAASAPQRIMLRVWRDPAYAGLPVELGLRAPTSVDLGRASDLRLRAELDRTAALLDRVDILALGIVFILAGLYHIQLYRRRREQTTYLWFGTIAVFASLNMIFASVWGTAALDPLSAFYVSRTALHIAGASWLGFVWSVFGWPLKPIGKAYIGLQIAIAVLTLIAPVFVLVTLGDWLVFSLVGTFVLWFGVIPYQALRGNREARTMCIGLIFLASARLWQMLGGLGVIPPVSYVHWGFFALLLSIAVSLSNRFSRVHQDLDALNQHLEDMVSQRTAELDETVARLRESERLAVEAREAAQEASESKSLFLASMSHELRTPLNAILGFVQLLRRRHVLNEEARHGLSVIMRSGEHLLSLINDILSITKIEAGQMTLKEEPFDLHGLLDHVDVTFQPRADAKGLELVVHRSEAVPRHVCGDDGKLQQILINLLGNAIRYTHAGRIDLDVDFVDGQMVFTVRDTGYGIAENERDRLFTAFTQTASGLNAKEGTGLGLAISRANAQLMGGDITVESELDVGTTFVVTLRLKVLDRVATSVRTQRVVGLEPDQLDVRVLVVDDVTENRHILSALLTDAGFTVAEASTGRDAISKWESWKPDLIWMDIRMAGIDGIEATRIIRERERESAGHCVIIALTASAFDTDKAMILDAGCDDFVPKPFLDSVIFTKLKEHLGVRYTYVDEFDGTESSASPRADTCSIDVEALSAMPSDWLVLLERAVREGDAEGAIEVADQISTRDAVLAEDLRILVRGYRFDDINDALDSLRRQTEV